ncbi:MAG: epoxyqueuosine reductase QueH [Proteobacteria bacterium]|nr:epoxyqueuosine reductase QueH [Pseudomonadota bacterium]
MENLLLHCCCAPCATHPFEVLKGYNILPFFSNSNIQPEDEYKKRLDAFNHLCSITGKEPIIDTYEPEKWLEYIKDLENEPERGKRCKVCFEFRLRRAFEFAKKRNIKYITSSLTTTTYKDTATVFEVGRKLSLEYGIEFKGINFKKNDGHRKSVELSKKYGLYIQNYCGCIFSLQDRRRKVS